MNEFFSKSNIVHPSFPDDLRNILKHLPPFQNKQLSIAINTRLEKDRLVKNWVTIVGPKLAEHTMPLYIKDQKITVAVDESKWMAEMQQNEKQIKQKINEFIKAENKLSHLFHQKKTKTSHKKNTIYELQFILAKIPLTDYATPPTSAREHELDKETSIIIEGIVNHVKNNEKLKQVFSNILKNYYLSNRK